MKAKAFILSALLLAPTAGAAAVQLSQPQNQITTASFGVKYKAPVESQQILVKNDLPTSLSDEELDQVTGEGLIGAGIGGIGAGTIAALRYGAELAISGGKGTAKEAVSRVLNAAGEGALLGLILPEP